MGFYQQLFNFFTFLQPIVKSQTLCFNSLFQRVNIFYYNLHIIGNTYFLTKDLYITKNIISLMVEIGLNLPEHPIYGQEQYSIGISS
jgi:hypothetical protein